MNAAKTKTLFALGQSIWYDNINRTLLNDGTLKGMIDSGVIYGITTNPSIFAKAIPQAVYDEAIAEYAAKGIETRRIFDMLTVGDVQMAADMFRDLYKATSHVDGYVSLEVSPDLARDSAGTIRDVKRLAMLVDRPNVMFKIPGTAECIPAIRTLIAEGYSINVTLLFDVAQYEPVANAYLEGIEEFIANGGDARTVNSVASVFVSRIDSLVDGMLTEKSELMGRAGIAVMKEVYAKFEQLFGAERFGSLKARGAHYQRVLWASTSAKNPKYSPTMYIDGLVASNTVNTVPPATLKEYLNTGTTEIALCCCSCNKDLAEFAKARINLRDVCRKLQENGITAFMKSFDEVLGVLEDKRKQF